MKTLTQKIKELPQKPGVYVFKDKKDAVLYVGKAVKLKNRVSSYFRQDAGAGIARIKRMIEQIADLNYTVTDNEVESLILENNFIKQLKPKYNVMLRDDKNYLFIKVNFQNEIPTIELDRRISDRHSRFFGPYTSAGSVHETLRLIRQVFPYCTNAKVGTKPCFYYHLKKCPGVCIGKISLEDYRMNIIEKIIQFLEGKQQSVLKDLKSDMAKLSMKRQFEKAAAVRDQIFALNQILEKQKLVYHKKIDQDVFSLHQNSLAIINLFIIRGGKLIQKENFVLENAGQLPGPEILGAFLVRYYLETNNLPRQILLPFKVENQELRKLFQKKSKFRTHFLVPKQGQKLELIKLGEKNADEYLQSLKQKSEIEEVRLLKALQELQKFLGLKKLPGRIEAYDISNIQGKNAVGSMIVFDYARPKKQDYRKFKIRVKDTPDDFAMMTEMLARRFARSLPLARGRLRGGPDDLPAPSSQGQRENWPAPDLILIDGGKGQLAIAQKVLKKSGLKIPAIGLAKRLEEIFVPGQTKSLNLPMNSPALFLLQRIRDEAHRFAITYHRKLRAKNLTRSQLDEIPGVGENKKRRLLLKFGSIKNLRQASLTDIAAITGRDLAKKIKAVL
jgi:excinuclease ABC subunit C